MVFKKLLKAFLMLTPLLGIVLLVLSLLNLKGNSAIRKLLLGVVIAFWLFSTRPGAWLLMKPLESQYDPIAELAEEDRNAYVVVLGGGCSASGHSDAERLSESALRRVLEGVRIGQMYPNTELVFSGTSWRGTCDVGELGAIFAKKLFPSERIKIQYDSRDTKQEAEVFKLQFGKSRPVVIVTSASHMPRAVKNFKNQGIEVIPAPTDYKLKPAKFWISDILPSVENLKISETALHEYLGLILTF
ncbi:YdcF family protein [Schleiferia thermophila]|uniref:Uncharacterized SAM-binding protein YcdF (DUF218 family) n=1 Tax=Schleiferia thermophila TaxID=884107 RepID=A0A369A6B1_9FLAO|nr:ElyC/SanA/YdcF family protein [Schleiferia thermophila]RCX03617.1 uncharacterized SAM-binding protein YcdF (DUF218 family) [Schleiferia thermophila]GCD79852.1 membrane protein [Schleiferia thermophila]